MGGGEIIAIVVSALVILGALFYIIKAKKNGRKCLGCPDSSACKANCSNGKCPSCDSCGGCENKGK